MSETAQARLAGLARSFLGTDAAVAACDPREVAVGLLPPETRAAGGMADRRRREFAAGRRAARAAMAELGCAPEAILFGPDRAPIWPAGLVGSISHSDTLCLAVVARRERLHAVGVDIEPETDLPRPLWEAILSSAELRWLSTRSASKRGRLAKCVFSAKEAVYKCQYPLTRELLGFHEVRIDLDLTTGAFASTFVGPSRRTPVGSLVLGQLTTCEGHLLATAIMRRANVDAPQSDAAPFVTSACSPGTAGPLRRRLSSLK